MIRTATFTLTNAPKGPVTINNRYVFVDGVLVCNESDGRLLEPVLCAYYGCKLTWTDDTPMLDSDQVEKPSLAKTQTVRGR